MALVSRVTSLWRNLLHRDRLERDLDDELQDALARLIDEKILAGQSPDAARRAARLELDGVEPVKERVRQSRAGAGLETVLQDARYALRVLRRSPAFTVAAVTTLALGIGGTTAVFSVVDATLFQPFAYREPAELVAIHESMPGLPQGVFWPVNAFHFREWQQNTRAFENMALVASAGPGGMSLTGAGEPVGIAGARVTSTFFATLGVQPAVGRVFRPEEDQAGRDRVVIINDALWRGRFAADPNLVGQFITLDGENHEVVGILPANFRFPQIAHLYSMTFKGSEAPQIWKPFAATAEDLRLFGSFNYASIARLKAGVSPAQAVADLDGVQAGLASQVPGLTDLHAVVTPLHEQVLGRARRGLELTLAAVGIVLLIACVNISNLLLGRSAAQQREVAVRTAIGATRARLVRQMLVESVTLACVGGGLGIALAYGLVPLILRSAPADLPRLDEVHVDVRMLAFATVLAVMTGLVIGILPALRFAAMRPAATGALSTRTPGRAGGRLRSSLVGLEVTATAVCLIVGGLLLSSLIRLLSVDSGMNTERVLTLELLLPDSRYPNAEKISGFAAAAIERARALPGVVAVGTSNNTPLATGGGINGAVTVEGSTLPRPQRPRADQRLVTPGYFRAIGVPLKAGRLFSENDHGRRVAVVAAATANRLWPQQDPIGKRFGVGPEEMPFWFDVVGVVGDIRVLSLEQAPPFTIYFPQWVFAPPLVSLSVRTTGNSVGTSAALRQAIRSLDPELVIPPVRSMDEIIAASVEQRRFQLNVILVFAVLATLLASVGIYGVVSHAVLQRTNEFGVRLALGARASHIRALVVRQGGVPIVVGLAAGVLLSIASGRFIASLLFDVTPTDAVILGSVVGLLTLVSLAAMYLPARRAMRVDPMVALRME